MGTPLRVVDKRFLKRRLELLSGPELKRLRAMAFRRRGGERLQQGELEAIRATLIRLVVGEEDADSVV